MKKINWLALMAFILAGCAGGMIPGKLYSLGDAITLEFQIEKSRGTGIMTATNPATGEKFTGQYTGTYKGGGTTHTQVDTFDPTKRMTNDNMPGQGYTATSHTAPTEATARGVLMGDKGTVIELSFEIQPGFKPHGHGEGQDNKGKRYQVQF
jgi:hypothetical protein